MWFFNYINYKNQRRISRPYWVLEAAEQARAIILNTLQKCEPVIFLTLDQIEIIMNNNNNK